MKSRLKICPCLTEREPVLSHTSDYSTISNETPSLSSCANTVFVLEPNVSQQLILPSQVRCFDMCRENMDITPPASARHNNPSLTDEGIDRTDVKLCTCSKRQRCENDASVMNRLEALSLSKRSLQSMHDDGLVYIRDLVSIFLHGTSQFEQLLRERYHLPAKQARLFFQVLDRRWIQYQLNYVNMQPALHHR